ncbi:hypothetical protein ABZP36_016050 [Zizania latifolia]
MGSNSSSRAVLLLCFCTLLFRAHGSRKLYIVYLGDVKHSHSDDVVASHHDMLTTVLGSKEDSLASIVHNYKHGFSGFAAMLTEDQAKQLAEFPEVISVEQSRTCTKDDLNATDVRGRIVLCLGLSPVMSPLTLFPIALKNVLGAGGSGLIFAQYTTDLLDITTLCNGTACVLVDLHTAYLIGAYIIDASSPVAKIEPARTVTGERVLAPKVAAFSSRGPSVDYPDIIKASYNSGECFHFISDISAFLHLSNLCSILHGEASVTDGRGMPILAEGLPRKVADPFDYGGGHINPNRAADPGLIYDIDPYDYNKFFGCTIKPSVSCNATSLPGYHLNLPSISVPDLRYPTVVSRTVTNIAEVDAVYHAAIESPPGIKMDVEPSVLEFSAANKVHTFQVKLSPLWKMQGDYTFGSLTWHNARRMVRIPIAVRITIQDFYADVA